MSFLELFKVDAWWKGLLLLGVAACGGALYFDIEFIQGKHLFGLGFGLLITGISFWIAKKEFSTIKPANAYTGPTMILSWKQIHHNWVTVSLSAIGVVMILAFGFLIIKGLI